MLRSILDILATALNFCSNLVLGFFNGIDSGLISFFLACLVSFMICCIVGRLIHHGGMGISRSDISDKITKKKD